MLMSRRLLGLPVIDLETGKALGRVSRFLLDPRARRVVALIITSGPWARDEQVLLWEQARGVGPAAITVAGRQALTRAAHLPQLQALLRRPVRTYGARVLTEDGTFLGTVEELVLDPATGQVVELLLAATGLRARLRPPMALPAFSVVVMGEDAVVAREGSRPYPFRPGRPLSERPLPEVRSAEDRAAPDSASPPNRPAADSPAPADGPAPSPRPSPLASAAGPAPGDPARPGWMRLVVPLREITRRGLQYVRGLHLPGR